MSEVFGQFIEVFPRDYEALELSFTFSSRPRNRGWRNNRLSAYFIADYFSTFLPVNEDNLQEQDRLNESKNAVSYIGNELLENAIKFNEDRKHNQVKFGVYFLEDTHKVTAVIFTKNSLSIQKVEKFQTFIKELLSVDPNELYVQQIEKAAEDENAEASGLGLLTMINDYSAQLGWKFESDSSNPKFITVTTMAQIVV